MILISKQGHFLALVNSFTTSVHLSITPPCQNETHAVVMKWYRNKKVYGIRNSIILYIMYLAKFLKLIRIIVLQ